MPNYYTNDSTDLESKTKKVDTLIKEIETLEKQKEAIDKKMPDLEKQQEVIDEKIANTVKAIDEIFPHSSSNNRETVVSNLKEDDLIKKESNTTPNEIATPEKIIKIKKIPIVYVDPEPAYSDLKDYAVVINYGKYDVAIGTTIRIIESYRVYAIASYNGVTPISDEFFKLTISMPCNGVIDSTWKKLFSDRSQVKFLADKEIIDLYSSIRGAELIAHFNNFKRHFLNDYTTHTKEKIKIKTTAMDGDLNLGPYVKDGPMNRMVTLDDDGHEVVIGTTAEISNSQSENYENKTRNVGVKLCTEIVRVSATQKSIDSCLSKLPAVKLNNTRECIDDYCSYYYSKRGTELVKSNSMVDEHEIVIDKVFTPVLSISSSPNLYGEDVVDGNQHEVVIGAMVQEHD